MIIIIIIIIIITFTFIALFRFHYCPERAHDWKESVDTVIATTLRAKRLPYSIKDVCIGT